MPAYDEILFKPAAPMALVTLRDRNNGSTLPDVPMLIDTGADVTLLPLASVGQLGALIDFSAEYELVGFDGGRSIAQSVKLDLLFLRRAFKGRYLLIEQEWGILGRDVLNHVVLSLDGRQQRWEEIGLLAHGSTELIPGETK
jgi:hypothetical protein